ncbi:MAG TPA: ABC transporter permease [Mesotoga infera]|jgi:ABC-2 type transport system permease protein|uniref:ABC-type multidrug transport system, permease component n=1 Tax=Mesotoga infera TaxID=1236046 RepID=A0A7Z7PNW9_9BACT|nr:ABC transporter permease [Mesotoga infera]MBP8660737.1 ABC transporter permease [Mesotoga sp.]NLI06539.1 ABC transporter permease [Thermotogaceae bacterium]SSC12390.1 ABC-type multidrug transport system, permease component [Mesotoga infera]HNR79085.1 ABC transporter permease [Mesotoga infera]HNS67339.1 ABC transporter permease [Mesotoga infera]
MSRMLKFTSGLFKNEIREFQVMFWSFIFPLILYFILTSVFGGMATGNPQGISFNLGIVKEENLTGFGRILDEVLGSISSNGGPFVQKEYGNLDEALEDLKNGKQDIVLVIPKGTNAKMTGSLMLQVGDVPLRMHYISGKESSSIAANILGEIMNEVNLEIKKRQDENYIDIASTNHVVSAKQEKGFDYNEYIFPGVALMMILSVSLFNSPIGLIQYRVSGTNKKLYTTPLKPLEYFSAHFVKLIFTMLMSLVLLYIIALTVYRVQGTIFDPGFILSLIYSMLVSVSFGLMVASFAKKLSTATVVGQSLYQVMMFMGGLYFPVFDLPWGLRWIVYLLPTTYLVELSRRFMGYTIAPISMTWLIVVPLIWMIFSVSVFALNFRKVMGYE